MKAKRIPTPHPGEILLEEFLIPMGISQYLLAQETGLSITVVEQIISGALSIDKRVDETLAAFLGMSKGFWLGLQEFYNTRERKL